MKRVLLAVGTVFALGIAQSAHATTIKYQATDLADTTVGEDLWKYQYFVSGFSFQPHQGFSVYFDDALYRNLQSNPPAPNANWDILVQQPDITLNLDGVYDALALVPNASLADPFVLTFVWLGGVNTAPGSQPFTVNQFDTNDDLILATVERGQTVPVGQPAAVPEPSTLLLVSTVGAGWLSKRRRRRTS